MRGCTGTLNTQLRINTSLNVFWNRADYIMGYRYMSVLKTSEGKVLLKKLYFIETHLKKLYFKIVNKQLTHLNNNLEMKLRSHFMSCDLISQRGDGSDQYMPSCHGIQWQAT